jgi:hypothetical protein
MNWLRILQRMAQLENWTARRAGLTRGEMQAEAKQCLHVFPEGSSTTQRAHKNKKTEKGTRAA